MTISAYAHMKGMLHDPNGSSDLHIHAIATAADDRESIQLREVHDRVIV